MRRLLPKHVVEEMLALASKPLTLTGEVADPTLVEDLRKILESYDDD